VAHAGVVKALQEHGFQINAISGVSSGAIVGALLAKGLSPDEILEIAAGKLFSSWKPPFSLGILKKKRIEKMLSEHFPDNSFGSLRIPLTISATNINTCQTDFFSEGELLKPLVASSAIPLLFSPVEINGYQYLDGGMINNFPVEPFAKDPLPVIGVHVNPPKTSEHISNTLKIVQRSLELSAFKNVQWRKKECRLVIEPENLVQYAVYDFEKSRDIFIAGYEAACAVLEKMKTDGDCFHPAVMNKSAA